MHKNNNSEGRAENNPCLLYTSDAADERSSVDLGGRRIIKKKKKEERTNTAHIKHNTNLQNESIHMNKTKIENAQAK